MCQCWYLGTSSNILSHCRLLNFQPVVSHWRGVFFDCYEEGVCNIRDPSFASNIRGHSFSTYAKFSEKLTFLTP